jgi:hypothetical protein
MERGDRGTRRWDVDRWSVRAIPTGQRMAMVVLTIGNGI